MPFLFFNFAFGE
uniref:Uncharacterized protein n=1 Tax=Rhizophora mucronata TaxID=61149 RepID=A0A2P2P2G7_RHIMU